uniref:AAA ATPase domain-containing protein n=1 Tax=Candidatus Kentrum sp. MB TaxID=2138164 RepID=A0A450XEN2_9GAMM|nr:MAG: AAA ATPase domain-containing protein [Candidatus Kentron sp. MB]VFK30261.1 MAG: AAA ATPase domain-containing protein [Candidatus Kentron sp. MB]VFK75158.1 MAG: AAA ATPase domain-containing protein [Candidatus Kentron sp. MB]
MNKTFNFRARLGHKANPGFLPQDQRLAEIQNDKFPFVTGQELPENAPTFFGRDYVMHEILAALRHPDKPRCISLLGERHIGKSSLLNQVFAALGQEEGLITIHADIQDWSDCAPDHFFTDLQHAIQELFTDAPLDTAITEEDDPASAIIDYPRFRTALLPHARRYRFLLILDEFETLIGNPHFDARFFTDLRHLGSAPGLRFGYLIATRRPLSELRDQHQPFDSSAFWDIFGIAHVLGLLQPEEGLALMQEPWKRSLNGALLSSEDSKRIRNQVGLHPALLQIVLERHWWARDRRSPEADKIKRSVSPYLQELWEHRSQAEKEALVRILGGKSITQRASLRDLHNRGLIIKKDQKDTLFATLFEEFIRQTLEQDPELSQILTEPETKKDPDSQPPRVKKVLNSVLKWAGKIGEKRGSK